ncbi:unnamed protein product [Caenorhabditis bovis]|uniref:ShKT domain-containing protein n=1 Tax=Caenorhabditis bovis TaxID=2654633 RepID=A0A8S1FB60_9PELO|nr:unnamed protein product [Caenorhabditis bovis]
MMAFNSKLLILASFVAMTASQNSTRPPRTCRTESRSACFLGKCPAGFECVADRCCNERDVVQPGGDCKDFVDNCETIDCHSISLQEFARANCARTCNMCYATGPVSPKYACTDLLPDCQNRTKLCQDIDFVDMMALFCPRTCTLCLASPPTKLPTCSDLLTDCANRGDYCTSNGVSDYQKRVGCGNYCGLCGAKATAAVAPIYRFGK